MTAWWEIRSFQNHAFIMIEPNVIIKNRDSGNEEVFDIDNMTDGEVDKLITEWLQRLKIDNRQEVRKKDFHIERLIQVLFVNF